METTETQETKAAPASETAAKAPKAKRARKPARKAAKSSKGRKAKGSKKVARKARAPKAEAGPCICGCGKKTLSAKRQFLQGHDAKLHSLFLQIGRGEEKRSAFPKNTAALEYVRHAPWSSAAKIKAFNDAK